MTPLKLAKCREIALARTGKPGVGRSAANELNARAHYWVVRSPCGKIYRFTNLSDWARKNTHLFMPDERPYSKTDLWKRVAGGIYMLFEVNGRCCSYRGWTAVSRLELINGGGDLLGRDRLLEASADKVGSDPELAAYVGRLEEAIKEKEGQ